MAHPVHRAQEANIRRPALMVLLALTIGCDQSTHHHAPPTSSNGAGQSVNPHPHHHPHAGIQADGSNDFVLSSNAQEKDASVATDDAGAPPGPEISRSDQGIRTPSDDMGVSSPTGEGGIDEGIRDAADRPVVNAELSIHLPIEEAIVNGPHSRLSDGFVLLDPTASLQWRLSDEQVPVGARVRILLNAKIWRYEDGDVTVRVGRDERRGLVWGDGRGGLAPVRYHYAAWFDQEYGASHYPPEHEWMTDHPIEMVEIKALGGGLFVGGAHLVGPMGVADTGREVFPADEPTVIDFNACEEDGCDDGQALTELIANAPEGALRIQLVGPSYKGHSPVMIERSNVHISGRRGEQQRPTWLWSPRVDSGQQWPFQLRGDGPTDDPPALVVAGITSGQRVVEVEGRWPELPNWVRLTAMDFGEVPPACLMGRDIEKYHRHQRQLFEVLSGEVLDETTRLVLDRAIHVSIPSHAQPTMTPVHLLAGIRIEHLHLDAECPETLDSTFEDVACTNREVLDDGGILSLYTDGAQLQDISARGFGKFSIEIRDSLRNRLSRCEMDHPSAYGSGGQGYGVHLIGASRTIVDDHRVQFARHGVVIDFGSSDSQVLDGEYSDMNQALVDVHGEASRDSLIRGNTLRNGTVGVIVGGGGRQVHCNDGPRHHIIDNTITECNLSGVSVNDSTREVFVRSNTMADNTGHLNANFGGHAILAEHNHFMPAGLFEISLAFDGSRAMSIIRNRFDRVCEPGDAFVTVAGAEAPDFQDNLWCPE